MAEIKPNRPIRRFDVFAEYQRLKGLNKDRMTPDVAKGYGIWLAKLVAARKFNRKTTTGEKDNKEKGQGAKEEELVDNKWRTLDGEPQTDALFDKEIIQRMGPEFYQEVFSPAIQKAYQSGEDYKDIRDTLRKDWKP